MTCKTYNGFSPAQRRAGHIALNKALAAGIVPSPSDCSVCGAQPEKPLGWHSEDYRTPFGAYAVCWRCHHAIHIRFRRPAYWKNHVSKLDPDGWFQALSLDPETLTRPFDETYPNGLTAAGGVLKPLPIY